MTVIPKLFTLLGFNVSDEGTVTTTTLYAKWMCNLLVRDGRFIKTGINTYVKK